MPNRPTAFLAFILLIAFGPFALAQSDSAQTRMPPLTVPLPAELQNQEAIMLKIDLEPGQASQPHRHNAHVLVYVLSGEIEMSVNHGEVVRLGPGETFVEMPSDVHSVSRNASNSENASFLVVMIKEAGAAISMPAN